MPFCNDTRYFTQEEDPAYELVLAPGAQAPYSGIYRCEGCGSSAISPREQPLPPPNHHVHGALQGQIRWRLIARTTHP
ncbi:hypothetical protein IC580_05575 [Cupriavidus sp. ISTL7]|nr:hypothetical protein IC580_05575 [Cupriavidus sp. ISTL7]